MIHRFKTSISCLSGILLLGIQVAFSQQQSSVTIDSCYAQAERNYPLIKQYDLIERTKEFSVSNAEKGYLPRITVAGQASYQSDVTTFPNASGMPGFPEIPKDQYRLYGEINQPLTGLFFVKDERSLSEARSDTDEQNLQVQLYKLKERINQLYFGILLLDEQMKQISLLKEDLQSTMKQLRTAIEYGTAINSSLDELKAELLNAEQRLIEYRSNRAAYTEMLSSFTGKEIDENTRLEIPFLPQESSTINRPELRQFESQKQVFQLQNKLIDAKNVPQFNLFFQGGLGQPGLNILNEDLDTYFITGIRLHWNISTFYTSKKDKQINDIRLDQIDTQRETFLFNTSLELKQQRYEINKIRGLINTDNDIITLRENIKNTKEKQLEYGTATSSDYIIALNAVDRARQNLVLHRIQLLMARYRYQNISGN